jgi:hypothetical protein
LPESQYSVCFDIGNIIQELDFFGLNEIYLNTGHAVFPC